MIVAPRLLSDGRRLVTRLVDDIRDRVAATEATNLALRDEYAKAVGAGRTGESFEVWREERFIQSAVAWVLATVFARFCEDNGLVDEALIAGVGERLDHARDRQRMHFRAHPEHSDRDYLLATFKDLGALPGMGDLLDPAHNALWALPVTADGASDILELFRRQDPDTGRIVHDFTDPGWGTRFLGDLYQDLSDDARSRYALFQTPEFVERFLLDRTLGPAIDAFGLEDTTLIDPTCGSGHFLLGAFDRLLRHWRQREPGTPERVLAQRALDAVAGVDLNAFAVAIARFRLLVAALRASHIRRLVDAPDFRLRFAVGDSLLHGRAPGRLDLAPESMARAETAHVYRTEDAETLAGVLGVRYAVVVGNPPYPTVKDRELNRAYRDRFPESCRGKYSLAVPFTERFLDLAHHGSNDKVAGFVGMITADSFMKREMGKKLVEGVLPKWDLTHVIHTSGAYIPGHGTPTVILLARARGPASDVVRTVMGIRGEPGRPADPAKGLVWTAIVDQVDEPGSQSDFVSVADTPRSQFATHPWSIGGGGAADLKERLDRDTSRLEGLTEAVGVNAVLGEDEVFAQLPTAWDRRRVPPSDRRSLVTGEFVRDWYTERALEAFFPYSALGMPIERPGFDNFAWPWRTHLASTIYFGKTRRERGLRHIDYAILVRDKLQTPLSITFAFVATHNHFVLDRGGKVFNRSAPVIKLPAGAGEDAHLGLLGLVNSATACFWMKQTFHGKGVGGIGGGIGDEDWEPRFEFDATKLKRFPLPSGRPLERARRLDRLAQELTATEPQAVCERTVPTRVTLDEAQQRWNSIRGEMIATQEELDWEVLDLYGLGADELVAPVEAVPPLELGQRSFEIVLARKVAAGEAETSWFARHDSTPVTEIPDHWPEAYRRVVEARIARIESDRNVGLIERAECKRRWAVQPWDQREQAALRAWLLDRLEAPALWQGEPRLRSTGALADQVRTDADFVAVAAVYTGRPDSDLTELVTELVADEAVPFLAALRYSEAGLRKRALWERTWDLQRAEDAGADVGTIAVPPKYAQGDFARTSYWKLRGKLDVAKERFVSYPHAGRDADPSPVVGWAGWDHRQQALALATWLVARRDADGWDAERLTPLLAGLAELLPWVRQWHPDVDPGMGQSMGDYLTGFLDQTLLDLGLTAADLAEWRPPAPTRGRRRRTAR